MPKPGTPSESMETDDLGREKRRVFELGDIEKRQLLERAIGNQDALVDEWKEKKIDTATALDRLDAVVADQDQPPIFRLAAFEHIAQLAGREETENRDVVLQMIRRMMSEGQPEVQNAMLGIFGARTWEVGLVGRENRQYGVFGQDSRKKEGAEDDQAAVPPEVSLQAALVMKVLQGIDTEARSGEKAGGPTDETLQDAVEVARALLPARKTPGKHDLLADALDEREDNALRQRITYMGKLYGGRVENLWPALEGIEMSEPNQFNRERELWIPSQRGRMLLPEGKSPSVAKELRASDEPRASGIEKGHVVPLRVYLARELSAEEKEARGARRSARAYEIASLAPEAARRYVSALRDIVLDRTLTREEKEEKRTKFIAVLRQEVWAALPEKDREAFGDAGQAELRAETLVDEDLLKKLYAEFGIDDISSLDMTGELSFRIDSILADDAASSKSKLENIRTILKARLAGGTKAA